MALEIIKKDIISNLKIDVSISNFEKECKMKHRNNLNSLKRVAGLILFLLVFSGTAISAYIGFQQTIRNNKVYMQGSIKDAENSGYLQKVDMDYIYSENIGVKVDELSISDNDFNIVLDFDFSKERLKNNSVLLNYVIYDENNNIYCYGDSTINKKGKNLVKFYKEMQIDYNKEDWYENVYSKTKSQNNLIETQEKLKTQISLKANNRFPRSKKIYVRIFEIGYLEDLKYKNIAKNTEWILEVDLSEKFYNRETVDFILKEEIEGFSLEEAYITDTSMTIKATIDNMTGNIKDKVVVIDENGKEYISENINSKVGKQIILNYSINKDNVESEMKIKVLINNEYVVLDLERKEK